MSQNKNFFRTVFDAMIESRSRQAAREISFYRDNFELTSERKKR